MEVDNRKTLEKVKKTLFTLPVVFVTLIVGIIFLPIFDGTVLNDYRTHMAVGAGAGYFLIMIFYALKRKNYIYLSDNSSKIEMRFFSMQLFAKKRTAIEIPKTSFYKYDLQKKSIGLVEEVTLFQKTPKGVAKYPPVSITALTKKEREDFFAILNKYKKA
ncbi:MAG: hypothetical protein C0594_14125 [Marinilabiliales bacterium]|nr:MAG: hypothetical protein C0594_14125 [Marinilabiliales bacterium]